MRIVYIEPFSGISGDMMVGALLDLGFDLEKLREQLLLLPVEGYRISCRRTSRAGIGATRFEVQCGDEPHHAHADGPHHHRKFSEIRRMIEESRLSDWVRAKSVSAFQSLAEAEGKIHGRPPEEVEFHEVGAVDSIVDTVGTMIAAESLLPARFLSAPVNLGNGTVECRHGIYPVPGPATQEILKGVPVYSNAIGGELTTPTGAALLRALVHEFGPRPMVRIERTGYGAGSRDLDRSANVLRITVAAEGAGWEAKTQDDQVCVIDTTIDDMSPQVYGYFADRALSAGALDVYATPIQMKKNRPGFQVTVLCAEDDMDRISRLIFAETTTIGIRYTLARRKVLERNLVPVETEFGTIRVKVSTLEGRRVNYLPEYEDCRQAAEARGVALKEIQAAAVRAYLQKISEKSLES